jgi:hypothetical protein
VDALTRPELRIDSPSPGEWIVVGAAGGRSLHVYRLASGDWLVSEVGRGNEGRGHGLREALAALSGDRPVPEWWAEVPDALEPRR